MEAAAPPFRIECRQADEVTLIRLHGSVDFRRLVQDWPEARRSVRVWNKPVVVDLAEATTMDGGSMALLLELKVAREQRGQSVEIRGASGGVERLLDFYLSHPFKPSLREPPREVGLFDQVGRTTALLVEQAAASMDYVGDVVVAVARVLRRPATMNWRDVLRLIERAGADGLPIVLLINLLVGVTLGIQGAIQLKQYGGNVYVADLVGIVVTRSIGPLMTAIIVAGRSGAAFAAELGTMKVAEEVDALRVLGINPVSWLVLPRVAALLVAVPLLTLFADVAGIAGGLFVGLTSLDLNVSTYVERTRTALVPRHVLTGIVKSFAFAAAIGLIACRRGLATAGGAQGVGRSTTSAVVTIILFVVILEAVFTALFQVWGV